MGFSSNITELLQNILLLVILIEIKHHVVDFVQPKWIISNKWSNKGWFGASLTHAGLHGLGTGLALIICHPISFIILGLSIIDTLLHMIIDRIKIIFNGSSDASSMAFWGWFALDQFLHQMTYILIIVSIVYYSMIM